jgi:hypothetical protein
MLDALIIQKTLRVPKIDGPDGDGTTVARQLDAALLSVGFKLSRPLLDHLGAVAPGTVIDAAVNVLAAARRLVGDHVEHNVYFKDFPANVPDTMEFWLGLLSTAMVNAGGEPVTSAVSMAGVNLLDLPGYGAYRHSYQEMAASRAPLVPADTDRVTVLHLGDSLEDEARRLYIRFAASPTPLQEDDLELLGLLAALCVDGEQPAAIPVRENKAVVNRVRLAHGKPLLVDTVTDVLRLACAVSCGDVTLESPTLFVSLSRWDRRTLLAALDRVVAADSRKLEDVAIRSEPWKRLGERLHPHEYASAYPHAAAVFQVARGEFTAPSLTARAEALYGAGRVPAAVGLLATAPGLLLRQVDRAARVLDGADMHVLTDAVESAAPKASGRVLLSLREHLDNRATSEKARVFVNRRGRAWIQPDFRPPIDTATIGALTAVLDAHIAERLPKGGHLVVDPAVYGAAVPLSGKNQGNGFQVMPRGSRTPVTADHLRFFVYWKETADRTDFDLSAVLLDEKFDAVGHLGFTNLSGFGGVHSGDITSAPDGASEFIDLDLRRVKAKYIVPQVNIYSGEGFDEVAESFFGYMERSPDQFGKPFEAATVRMRSDLRGPNRIALPLAFEHGKNGWSAVWMQMFLRGTSWGNRVETNRMSSALLAQAITGRKYLTVGHLVDLMRPKADAFTEWRPGMRLDGPVTFIGLGRPDGLPDGSDVYTLDRLNALVPA